MKKNEGFTLIELVVVLGMFGLVMLASYTILETTIEADRRVQLATMTGKVGEAILNQMRRDIQGVVWRGHGQEVFQGQSRGDDDNGEDTIDFLTTAPVPEPEETISSWTGEVTSVGYALKSGDDEDLILFRRVAWDLQSDHFNKGTRTAIYDRVMAMDIRYLNQEEEWVDDWDASSILPEENLTDFPFLDEEEFLAAEDAALAAENPTTGSQSNSSTSGSIDRATGEEIPEEPLPLPIPKAVEITLYLHYGDERGQILDSSGEPVLEVFSTVVPLITTDQVLIPDPDLDSLEGLLGNN